MYIGKLGDGSSEDDGIYALLKEVLDNCIDEFVMGFGKQIEVESDGYKVEVRDHGRESLEKLLDCRPRLTPGRSTIRGFQEIRRIEWGRNQGR